MISYVHSPTISNPTHCQMALWRWCRNSSRLSKTIRTHSICFALRLFTCDMETLSNLQTPEEVINSVLRTPLADTSTWVGLRYQDYAPPPFSAQTTAMDPRSRNMITAEGQCHCPLPHYKGCCHAESLDQLADWLTLARSDQPDLISVG